MPVSQFGLALVLEHEGRLDETIPLYRRAALGGSPQRNTLRRRISQKARVFRKMLAKR